MHADGLMSFNRIEYINLEVHPIGEKDFALFNLKLALVLLWSCCGVF